MGLKRGDLRVSSFQEDNMYSKQDIVKPRTPEDVVRSYGLRRDETAYVEPHIKVGDTVIFESQLKKLLELLKK